MFNYTRDIELLLRYKKLSRIEYEEIKQNREKALAFIVLLPITMFVFLALILLKGQQ